MSKSSMDITAEKLINSGYREYPAGGVYGESKLFQKRVCDDKGTKYFINFREWDLKDFLSYDTNLTCETNTAGYVWLTFKEDTIEKAEDRAKIMWEAAGSVYYESNV